MTNLDDVPVLSRELVLVHPALTSNSGPPRLALVAVSRAATKRPTVPSWSANPAAAHVVLPFPSRRQPSPINRDAPPRESGGSTRKSAPPHLLAVTLVRRRSPLRRDYSAPTFALRREERRAKVRVASRNDALPVRLHGHAADAEWPRLPYDDDTADPALRPAPSRPIPTAVRVLAQRAPKEGTRVLGAASMFVPQGNGMFLLEAPATASACAPSARCTARSSNLRDKRSLAATARACHLQQPPAAVVASGGPAGLDLAVSSGTCGFTQAIVSKIGDMGRV